MPLHEITRHALTFLAETQTDSGGGPSSDKIALYSMVGAIVVAVIYNITTYLTSSKGRTTSSSSSSVRRVLKQRDVYERFFLVNGIDPRKIKTGYESLEEARRVEA